MKKWFKRNPNIDKLREFMNTQIAYLEELESSGDTDELDTDVMEELVDAFIEVPQDFWNLWNKVAR